MKRNSMSRILLVVTPMMIICCLLVLGTSAVAQSCSNKTIKGDYGCSIHGSLIFGATQLPFVGVTMGHNDGDGNSTGLEHVVVNGNSFDSGWDANSGTYTVNPDCTGTLTINVPGNPFSPVKLHFVVVRQGKEIRTVVEANAVSSIGIKIE